MSKSGCIKFLAILVLTGIFLPHLSAFALIGEITDIGECALRNRLKEFLKAVLAPVVQAVKQVIKSFACGALSFFTAGFVNCPDEVITKGSTEQQNAKEQVEDAVARCIARQALTRMTKGILEIVREDGRDGGPTYIQDWRNFTLESQYRGENIWRGLLYIAANGEGNTPPLLCDHIRNSSAFKSLQPKPIPNLLQSLGPNRRINSQEEYLIATKCDPAVDENFDVFMNDFSAGGGWEMFELLSKPQNNIFGAIGMAFEELEKQRSLEEKIATNEAVAGRGFLGVRGENASDSCLSANSLGRCVVYKNIKTPGFVIGESAVEAAIKSELNWIVNTDEIHELLTDMFFVTVARLKNLGAGDIGTPPIELPDVGGSAEFQPEPTDICVESCIQTYCDPTGSNEYDCSNAGSELNACTSACYEPENGGNGNGGGSSGPCATQEEIDQFLIDNPGDEGRLSSAFPCP